MIALAPSAGIAATLVDSLAASLALTGVDSQIVAVLGTVAGVLAGAGVVLLAVRLVMSRRARAAAATPAEQVPAEQEPSEHEPGAAPAG